MSQISTSWALQQTSNDVFSVAKGVLQAATSDNVQPLALLAVEAFGATVAICQQTQMIVEKEASLRHTNAVLNFLQSSVGYSANDSATYLSRSSSGVRFLSIASALSCMSSHFAGAEALNIMLEASAVSGQLQPTIGQLCDLLKSLEPKLVRTGFAMDIAGWDSYIIYHPLVQAKLYNAGKPNDYTADFLARLGKSPSGQEVTKLVDCFRALGRIGDDVPDSTVKIVLTARTSFAWIVAFTKWSLGTPPTVYLDNDIVLVDEPRSPVTLSIPTIVPSEEPVSGLSVQEFSSITGPSDLWSDIPKVVDAYRPWSGMVSISQYAKYQLRDHTLPPLHLDRITRSTRSVILQFAKLSESRVQERLEIPNLPPLQELLESFDAYFGDIILNNQQVNIDKHVSLESPKDPVPTRLYAIISDFVLDILTISFFNFADLDKILLHVPRNDLARELTYKMATKLTGNDTGDVNIVNDCFYPKELAFEDFHYRALLLLGYEKAFSKFEHKSTWVASCQRGQAIYPTVYESLEVDEHALVRLTVQQGILYHKNCSYTVVRGVMSPGLLALVKYYEKPVDGPRNFTPAMRAHWFLAINEESLELGVADCELGFFINPANALRGLSNALYVARCSHAPNSSLDPPDGNAYFVAPCKTPRQDDDGKIAVIPFAGNGGLRLYALGMNKMASVIVRGEACLACCLKCAREKYRFCIIL